MITLIALLKRHATMTQKQFENYYENVHSKQVHYIKHLILSYERNYPTEGYDYGSGTGIDAAMSENRPPAEYDCVTRMTFADRAAFEKVRAVLLDPTIKGEVEEDEAVLFDRPRMKFLICETHVTDLTT
jgi:hypothetical protein